jgi:hypothetical protein
LAALKWQVDLDCYLKVLLGDASGGCKLQGEIQMKEI